MRGILQETMTLSPSELENMSLSSNYNIKNILNDRNGSSSPHGSSAPPLRSPMSKKSPKKRTQSEMLSSTNRIVPSSVNGNNSTENTPRLSSNSVDMDNEGDHTTWRRRANFDKIPVFYVPGKRNNTFLSQVSEDDQLSKRLPEIEAFFKPFPGGIPIEKFVHVTKRLCGIPSFFNLPLCKRINERFGDPDSGSNLFHYASISNYP